MEENLAGFSKAAPVKSLFKKSNSQRYVLISLNKKRSATTLF
ncbi:hypothetical protein HMPREF7215_1121 [Pyramidobacter piscolens W5455]|uniref:Uncharacterized protein n=1 Tax=Pyramidobacter piscolens W5455 TaxID=352165 RepID=A0ABP2HTG7_9BACT|nr:hypothetical protein HMPREF7215_1121 [Pyramidobacter piscolens W5455]